jgi:hypothetical protein
MALEGSRRLRPRSHDAGCGCMSFQYSRYNKNERAFCPLELAVPALTVKLMAPRTLQISEPTTSITESLQRGSVGAMFVVYISGTTRTDILRTRCISLHLRTGLRVRRLARLRSLLVQGAPRLSTGACRQGSAGLSPYLLMCFV